MSYPFQRSIAIQAAPERVYEYLTNIPANREWGEMADLELLTDGPLRVGTRWRSSGKTGGVPMHDECEVTALEPHRRFSFKVESRALGSRWTVLYLTYSLTPTAEGTHLTFGGELNLREGTGLFRILGSIPVLERLFCELAEKLVVGKVLEGGLVRLRDNLEQDHAAQSSGGNTEPR